MKQTRLEQMQDRLRQRFGTAAGELVAQRMEKEYKSLCSADSSRPEALLRHVHNNIYPVVAAFRALLAQGLERSEAAAMAQEEFLVLMDTPARMIRRMMKVPGLYRLMPWLWKTLMPRLFSEDAGFRYRFHPADSTRVRFDMLECPYHQVCLELDCPELAPVFCATDDVCYGRMHPKLIWNRTKTIARGGDLCDFDLYIKK